MTTTPTTTAQDTPVAPNQLALHFRIANTSSETENGTILVNRFFE